MFVFTLDGGNFKPATFENENQTNMALSIYIKSLSALKFRSHSIKESKAPYGELTRVYENMKKNLAYLNFEII